MDCEQVRDEFIERLTGTLDPARAKAIDEHLAGCPACRAETERLREMWTELGTLTVPAAAGGAGRVERLVDARSRSQLPTRRRAIRTAMLTLGAVAASLALGVVLGKRATGVATQPVLPEAPAVATAASKAKYVLLLHGPSRRLT